MNEIQRVLRAAAWRMGVIGFLRALTVVLAAGLIGAILLRIAQQMFVFELPWAEVAYWSGGACIVLAAMWALIVRANQKAVARRVDEGANLKEALSTALCVASEQDPWSRATVESASRSARGVRVSAAVPIHGPRFWPVPLALGLALAVVFLAMPRMDVLGWAKQALAKKEDEQKRVDTQKQIELAKAEVQSKLPPSVKMEEEAKPEAIGAEKPQATDPEAIRRSAVKELTKLGQQLKELKQSEQAQKLESMKQGLQQLNKPGEELADLSKALAAGEFSQAKQELEKLKDQLTSGQMTAEQKEAVAKQLDDLAKQMEKLAQQKENLEKMLDAAGLDKKLASDPDKAKEAIENAANLTPEQKEALQNMCQNQSQCQEGMEGLAGACSKMAQGMKDGNESEASEGAQAMEGALSELEQIAAEMEMTDAAMSECQSQLASLTKGSECQGMGECAGGLEGTKPWSAGWNDSFGMGRGGPGQGQGGRPGEAAADHDYKKSKSIGPQGDGPVIGSRLVEGESIRGESRAEFSRVVAAADQGATEAIENNTIPREFHDAIKTYFGRLKGKTEAQEAPKEAAPDAKPADAAKP